MINNNVHVKDLFSLKYISTSHRISMHVVDENVHSITLSPQLSLQLGYTPFKPILNDSCSTHPANIILGLPSQYFIYCDIIEPQIVGDTLSKLLRNVSVDNSNYIFGSQRTIIFTHPYYIPVLRREFENIEIDIRTESGKRIPFSLGTVCIKLHFKRTSS